MCAIQEAEWLSTGRPVIGVFQTLSAGKAGQWVPGSVWPSRTIGGCPAAPVASQTHAPTSNTAAIRAELRITQANTRLGVTTNATEKSSAKYAGVPNSAPIRSMYLAT